MTGRTEAAGVVDTPLPELAQLLATMPDPMAGQQAARLEEQLADRFGVQQVVVVSSGTAALHTALAALGIGPGDEVLVPALSVVMSIAPVLYAGARPVFVDCRPDGYHLDLDQLTAKITPRTAAIMPVHLWGRLDDIDALRQVAARHALALIEDACQAQGSTLSGPATGTDPRTGTDPVSTASAADVREAGTVGDVGCFSLKDGKVLSCGEGGYLFTNDPVLADRARGLRSHWQTAAALNDPPRIGYNYRLAEPLALIAHANLGRFDALLHHRREQAALLGRLLTGTPGLAVVQPPAGWNGYTPLVSVILPDPRGFCRHLAALGVPNSVGTFGLVAADQRLVFAATTPQPCPNTAHLIDHMLAVVVTDRDGQEQITRYAQTITQEARRWPRC